MSDRILIRYDEIALKGDNRGWFEKTLANNITKQIVKPSESADDFGKVTSVTVKRTHGRMIVESEASDHVLKALKNTFGVSSFSPMKSVPTDMTSLTRACQQEARNYFEKNGTPASFCIRTKRTEKALPETSVEIDRKLGAGVLDIFPDWKVSLKKPVFVIGIELRREHSFLWTEKRKGHGGLPVGSNSPVLTLMSGGLDSPVAAIQVLRRGSATSFVHFYGTPFVGEEVLEKVKDLVRAVNRYQPVPKPLYVVPFGKIQEKIALATDLKMRTVLYRRMMLRIAEKIAIRIKAKALVTGESMGQVASQTVENLATINSVATLPVLRPLITHSKIEIVNAAHDWETFDISVRPGLDCCTLFSDRHPILRSTPYAALEQEKRFSVEECINEALEKMTVLQP